MRDLQYFHHDKISSNLMSTVFKEYHLYNSLILILVLFSLILMFCL